MTDSQKHSLFSCLLLALLVLAAFSPALTNDFVKFDDTTYITANPHVQAGLTWSGVAWAFQTSTASNWHPLTWLSHMLDYQIYGLRPWGHHLTSILLHMVNAVLVFLVFKSMTGAPWRSWFLAALFGLHPLRVESVAWAAERKDVLSGLFFLLTLLAYVSHVTSPTRNTLPRSHAPRSHALTLLRSHALTLLRSYALTLLLFTLGLLSKQMLVTLPFVLLLLDFWPLRRWRPLQGTAEPPPQTESSTPPPPKPLPLARLILEKVPFFLLAALFSLVVFLVQTRAGTTGMIGHLPLAVRLENAIVSYARYLLKLCWPLDLAVFYPHPGHWPAMVVALSLLLLIAITTAAWVWRRPQPWLLVGWLWYLGMLLPVIGLVQIGRQSIADRYTYLPVLGILLAMIWGLAALLATRPLQLRASAATAFALVLVCAALTYRQTGYWKDSETLFRHAIDAVPDNYLAHGNLAICLQSQGRFDEAFREIEEALRIQPDDVNTRNSFGSVLLNLGRVDEAIGQLQEAIRRWPGFAEAHSNLAFAYQRQGRLDLALAEFQAALNCNPGDYRLHVNLAGLLLKLNRPSEAIGHLQEAVQLEPGDAAIRKDLAALLFNAGRFDEAALQFQAAVDLAPNDAEAEANLGICLGKLGRADDAIQHLTRALKLRPNYPEAQQELQRLTEAIKH